MKLLIVNTVPTERNGITNVAFNLMRSLDKTDIEIAYVSITKIAVEYQETLSELGISSFVINRSISGFVSYIRDLARIAKGYDIIHVHGNSATMLLEMIAAKVANVTVRCTHGHTTSCSMKWLDVLARPIFYSLCNARIACGKKAGQWLFRKRDFLIVNNGVDTERFRFGKLKRDSIRKELGWGNKIILANVANFVEVKNHEFLIEVFSFLYKQRQDVRLLLLGSGPLMETAKEQARDLGIYDFINFKGSVSNISDNLSAIDLIIMPSKFEGLPLTLIEEQANGLSAVVSEAITKDANITGNVRFLSLESGSRYWSDYIEGIIEQGIERNESCSQNSIVKIKNAGYDIFSSAKQLKEYYIAKFNEFNG